MPGGMDPHFREMQQEVLRHKNIERAKKTAPGGKRDLKIIIGIFAGLIILSLVLLLL